MSDELKLCPCPLCNKAADYRPYKDNYLWSIGCADCKLWIQFVGPQELDESIAKWNLRPLVPQSELDQLKSQLAEAEKFKQLVALFLPMVDDYTPHMSALRARLLEEIQSLITTPPAQEGKEGV